MNRQRSGLLKAVISVALLDLRLWSRMPIAIVCALVPPVAMALFLVVMSLAVTQQPVALVADGKGLQSLRMANIIREDNDAYLLTETDAGTAKRLLSNMEVAAVITVPADFDNKIKTGQAAKVTLVLNNVDTDFADDIRRSVDRSVYRFAQEKSSPPSAAEMAYVRNIESQNETHAAEEREKEIIRRSLSGENPYLIKIDEQDLRDTNVPWLNYQVVPVLLLLVLNVGLVGTSLLCAQDLERKTALHLCLSPQSSLALVFGKLIGGFLASMIVLVPAILLCVLSGTIAVPANHWLALGAIFASTALFASSSGAIIGATMKGARAIAMASCIVATYLFLLGGGFTTIAFLPQWLRSISALVPTRYAVDGMRQAMFYTTLDGVSNDLIVLLCAALLCSLLAAVSIRRAWST